MGFDSGALSFRMFYLPKGMPDDAVERFAANAAPSLAALDREGISGWVTGHHLLDRDITEDRAHMAGYLYLQLMKAEQKIPEKLLRAEVKMGELVRLRDEGIEFITRKMRSEIRQEVIDRLLPDMPPTLSEIPMVYDSKERMLYVGALTDKQVEVFCLTFQQTIGSMPVLMTPEAIAMKRKQFSARDMMPTSFSPDCSDMDAGDSLGQDFLTWLWFFIEKQGALAEINGVGQIGAILEGPLTFIRDGGAASVAVLRKGTVLTSAEAKTSLMGGKKLKSAKLALVRRASTSESSGAGGGDEAWGCTLGADEFVFRGMKMPKGDAKDPVSRFHERMLKLTTFRDAFLGLYDRFLDLRSDVAKWEATQKDIHKWVTERTAIM
jgi:hypothetical protein